MKHTWLAALVIGILPTMAMAQHHHYDRGDRYHGGGYHGHSSSFFGISLGFGGDDWAGAIGYRSGGYGGYYGGYGYGYPRYYAPRYDYAPVYYAPAPPVVVYREPAYYAPPAPVVVYPTNSYYYSQPSVYVSGRYYYGR